MSKLNRIAIPIHLEDAPANNWELVREHDGLTKRSVGIIWIEFCDYLGDVDTIEVKTKEELIADYQVALNLLPRLE